MIFISNHIRTSVHQSLAFCRFVLRFCHQNSEIPVLEKAMDIAMAVGLVVTTVRTIKDRDGNKIKEAAKSAIEI